jgi:hypothetical protein
MLLLKKVWSDYEMMSMRLKKLRCRAREVWTIVDERRG